MAAKAQQSRLCASRNFGLWRRLTCLLLLLILLHFRQTVNKWIAADLRPLQATPQQSRVKLKSPLLSSRGKDQIQGLQVVKTPISVLKSFRSIQIWAWKGVYHQSKELARILSKKYAVTLKLFDDFPMSDPEFDDELYIIIPAHSASAGTLPPNYVLYQTEQLSHYALEKGKMVWANRRGNETLRDFHEAFKDAIEIWDFAEFHIEHFMECFDDASVRFRHVPFAYFTADPEVVAADKDIDVFFYGGVKEGSHRSVLLKGLQDRGINVTSEFYSVFEEGLTKLLRRSRIVLNIHFFPGRTMETCRILEAISFGALVITEPANDKFWDTEWSNEIVYAENIDALEREIVRYRDDEGLRLAKVAKVMAYAKERYSLEPYLAHML